jgi:hypothetical protein
MRQGERVESSEDIALITDYGTLINELTKEFEKDIKLIRANVLEYAKRTKTKKMAGKVGQYNIGKSTTTEYGGATELAKLLKKFGKINLFDEMTSVKVTEVKRYLGEKTLELEGFMKKSSNEYGKVTLKRK